ncbi:hypothetical protein NIES2109_39030 [Nostoc sp. HK-01]|nr:hypothetical protein NIES2109_39030 [Nostoc sp. HK-01]
MTLINYQSNFQKLPEIVTTLINNNPVYQENLDKEQMIEVINRTFDPISVPDINDISEEELTKRVKSILSLHLVSGMLNDFTPEQMQLFNEAVKRG